MSRSSERPELKPLTQPGNSATTAMGAVDDDDGEEGTEEGGYENNTYNIM